MFTQFFKKCAINSLKQYYLLIIKININGGIHLYEMNFFLAVDVPVKRCITTFFFTEEQIVRPGVYVN